MKKEKLKSFYKILVVFIFQIAFSKIQFGNILPLGFSFAICRIFVGENLFLVTVEYFVANLFLAGSFFALIYLGYEIVILSLYYFFKEMVKTKRKKLLLMLFALLSTMPKVYYLVNNLCYLETYLIETGVKILGIFFFLKAKEVYQRKLIFFKCSNFDYIIFSIFSALLLIGIFSYEFLKTYLGLFIIFVVVLLTIRFLSTEKFLLLSMIILLSFYFIFDNTKLLIVFVLGIILLISFSKVYKYLFLTLSLMIFAGLFLIMKQFNLFNVISLCGAIVVLICIPQKFVGKLSSYFNEKKLDVINDNFWKTNELQIEKNLLLMSKTLLKMKDDFKSLIVGKIDRKIASTELSKDVAKNTCETCENHIFCQSSIINKNELISEYIYRSIKIGKIKAEDVSIGFKTYCHKTNQMVDEINKIAQKYLQFEASVKSEDESKLIVSAELENFAVLFGDFAKRIGNNCIINKQLSFLAKEMLLNNMIEINDIAIFENENGLEKIEIVASNAIILKKELKETIEKIVKVKIQIKTIKHLEFSGLSLASFSISNSLAAEFAVSVKSKENISGDNYLITKIDDNRFFVAIADGMGHGSSANKTSKIVLELIKNLFAIGIDTNIIIDCVNKFLVPVGLNNFSTLDVAIVDLKLEKCTFIKLGASVSAIKHTQQTELVLCDSLPIGIVQNVKPTIVKKSITDGDTLFLASDGVVDFFGEPDNFKIFINDAKIVNLQKFADSVLSEINYRTIKHKDDMSLLAIKLLKKSSK